MGQYSQFQVYVRIISLVTKIGEQGQVSSPTQHAPLAVLSINNNQPLWAHISEFDICTT